MVFFEFFGALSIKPTGLCCQFCGSYDGILAIYLIDKV